MLGRFRPKYNNVDSMSYTVLTGYVSVGVRVPDGHLLICFTQYDLTKSAKADVGCC